MTTPTARQAVRAARGHTMSSALHARGICTPHVRTSHQHSHTAPAPTQYSSQVAAAASADSSLKAGAIASDVVVGDPTVTFPEGKNWAWERAAPKESLHNWPDDGKATPFALNSIELLHWLAFPVGAIGAYTVFTNAGFLGKAIAAATGIAGDESTRVFLVVVGLLTQVFAGASANMMHTYEGWMEAPFENPIPMPPNPEHPANSELVKFYKEVDARRIKHFNNAWLRTVTYQILFMFQSIGLTLFSAAAFGLNAFTVTLLAAAPFVGLVGPKQPRTNFSRVVKDKHGSAVARPFLPMSWAQLLVFAASVVVNLVGQVKVFAPAWLAKWPSLGDLALSVGSWKLNPVLWLVAAFATLTIVAGGIVEGVFAETDFNQWWHFWAYVTVDAGLVLTVLWWGVMLAWKF